MPQGYDRTMGRLGKPRFLVLGMDPGIASCGFALLDTNNHEILEMGSRLFDAPQEPKTGMSLAAKRRGFRSSRRNLDRTQDRLGHALDLFKEEGLVPRDATKEWFHTVKGDRPPLTLRVAGLDRALTDREWTRVLYSLAKRRGYIGHGAGSGGVDAEDGKVLSAIAANTTAFEASGYRTAGEWLAAQERSRNRQGSYELCVRHEQIVAEVQTLFERQRELGSAHAGAAFEASYLEVLSWERDRAAFDAATYELVGSCVYFPGEKRAARATLSSELVAAYGALGNVRIAGTDGSERGLTPEERDRSIAVLFSPASVRGNKECKVTYGALRRDLDLSAHDSFKGVRPEDEKKREVYEPRGWRLLRATLQSQDAGELAARLRIDRDLADAVFEAAAYASSDAVFRARLGELDLGETELDALARLPYASRALNGYGSRSKKALDLLLGMFEEPEVLTLTEAERASGLLDLRLTGHQTTRGTTLVPYEVWLQETGRTNNNPVVLRAMAQMRRVVNAICREWGVPDLIRVELDRELRLPKRAKADIQKAQNKNRAENERIAAEIAERQGCAAQDVKGSLIEKWRLAQEQGCKDAYTGEPIYLDRLLENERYAEVDHILPFSRTGDNSRSNKVLVLAKSNQDKRERTPYEWMYSGEPGAPSWDAYRARVGALSGIGSRKKQNLLEEDLEGKEGEFLARNVTDTAYMSREVCSYLRDCLEFPEDGFAEHVVPVKGQATAWLRRSWGLNFGLSGEKDRSDDRHHATDACVIAACDRALVQKTAHYSEAKRHGWEWQNLSKEGRDVQIAAEFAECQPWPGFADEVRTAREHVVPTRHVAHKGTGEAFEQTRYAYVGERKDHKDVLAYMKDGQRKEKISGNAVVLEDGKTALIVSEMAFVRLWHDSQAKRGRGQWYADPVYVADLPALAAGTYVPRIARAHVGRTAWEPIPEQVLAGRPLTIYLGDVVQVGEHVGRYQGLDIASVKWKLTDVRTKEAIKGFPTIGSLGNAPEKTPRVIREDVLGHCWRDAEILQG